MNQQNLVNLSIEWKRGLGLRKSDINEDGKYKCILYGELYTKHKKVLIESDNISRTNNIGSVYSKKGDILVPGTSTASKKDMLLAREIDEDGVIIGGDINVIRPKQGIFAKKYLPYYFDTKSAYDQLERFISGSTGIIHISNTGLKSLTVPLPTYPEQQRIVSIIDKAFEAIDKAIENTQKNLQNAKELFESTVSRLFELKGKDWPLIKLGEICKINDGTHFSPINNSEGKYMYITAKNIKPYFITLKNVTFISEKDHKEIYSRCSPKKGDVLYIKDGATTGIAAINDIDEEFSLLSSVALLKCSDRIINSFLVHYMNSSIGKENFLGYMDGAAITRLTLIKIKNVEIKLPPYNEQQLIVNKLDQLRIESEKLHSIYQQKLHDLEELKKSVLNKAFAGEL